MNRFVYCCAGVTGIGVLSAISFLFYKKHSYSFFQRFRYAGPEPKFKNSGNLRDFYSKENSIYGIKKIRHYSKTLYKWTKMYGKIYGYYEGFSPVLVISDIQLIDEIFIKQKNNLQYRRSYSMTKHPDAHNAHLFLNNSYRFLRVRKCLERVMNDSKNILKYLSCMDEFILQTLNTNDQASVDNSYSIYFDKIKKILSQTIFKALFDLSYTEHNEIFLSKTTNNQKTITDFVQDLDKVFDNYEKPSYIKSLAFLLNNTGLFKYELNFIYDLINSKKEPMNWFHSNFTCKLHNNDEYENDGIFSSLKKFTIKNQDSNTYLTLSECFSNTFLLFFGSYETTSTSILFACHVLDKCKTERCKLEEEIKNFHHDNFISEIPIDVIDKLKYLDLFVKELLRMFPVANSMVSRQCAQNDFYIGPNKCYYIPNGLNVVVDVLSVHYNKDIWGPVNPYEFYPERFLEPRPVTAWLPFGVGRRSCVGAKVATRMIKLFIVRLLERFEIENDSTDTNNINTFNSIETKETLFNKPVEVINLVLKEKVKNSGE